MKQLVEKQMYSDWPFDRTEGCASFHSTLDGYLGSERHVVDTSNEHLESDVIVEGVSWLPLIHIDEMPETL